MLGGTYNALLYDTPPNLEHVATGYAVQNADIALVVTSPFPADIWEAEETLRFVHATKLTSASAKKVRVPPSRP
jgi:chromosome partitioning protein